MRKLFMAAAAVLACMTVNAQIWVGGSLGFNSNKYDSPTSIDNPDCSEITLDFSPVVGYALNDKMDVGAELNITTVNNVNCVEDVKKATFGITPFARYKFFEAGKLSFHAQAQLSYQHNSYKTPAADSDSNIFNIGVKPLIKYSLSDNIAIVSSFGWLGFTKAQDDYSSLALDASSALSFGIYYAF